MANQKKIVDKLLASLMERAKELDSYYQIQEILRDHDESMDKICEKLIAAIPPGWQYPELCKVKITLGNTNYCSSDLVETPWSQSADIIIQNMVVGSINVYYAQKVPSEFGGPFLEGEKKLLQTIADRFSHYIRHRKVRQLARYKSTTRVEVPVHERGEWQTVLETIRFTDHELYHNIARRMLNHLCLGGASEADQLLKLFGISQLDEQDEEYLGDWNRPHHWKTLGVDSDIGTHVFPLAADKLDSQEIMRLIQKWVNEDKFNFLIQAVNINKPLAAVAEVIRRYYHITHDGKEKPAISTKGILISLIRRFLSDNIEYVNVAKEVFELNDFYFLVNKIIYSSESQGKLGGKSAGLLLANQILKKKAGNNELLQNIKTPKTWYVTSDNLLHFVHYSKFYEIVEQKYKPIDQIRSEYPYIVQTFKSVSFPPDIVKGLSAALDDFGDCPLIVRSSSLLEDSLGAAFSGKYKSLFVANKGSKRKRLNDLIDAIAEVYASTFGPDPMEYRADRGLLDFNEEMGILIQEVVGNRIGNYFLPAYAGVAFSCNEFLWSSRLNRDGGLIRIVPGLGTRAVDRLSDDYPVLISPGQPNLRVNTSPDEVVRYSPQQIDMIDLERNSFSSIGIVEFLKGVGYKAPQIRNMLSLYRDGRFTELSALDFDFERDEPVVTFDGLINRTSFVKQVKSILDVLQHTLGIPVDIEFASDGTDFYLLQCRPQSHREQCLPAPIPRDLPCQNVLFNAHRYVSNGLISDITHIVYVCPQKYAELESRSKIMEVGRAISKLNSILPKRRFILMGPGRWGSRGDIRLGVSVDYSDINNTSLLVEIALKKGRYVPELSFGTHFFQDLVEAGIRYLALYPDDDDILFARDFFLNSANRLPDLVPDFADLADVIKVIDVPACTDGKILNIHMNAEMEEAVGFLDETTKPA